MFDVYVDMKVCGEGWLNLVVICDIYMLLNICVGFVIVIFSLVFGFVLVWYIWWMVIGGFIGIIVMFVIYSLCDNDGYYIFVLMVCKIEDK